MTAFTASVPSQSPLRVHTSWLIWSIIFSLQRVLVDGEATTAEVSTVQRQSGARTTNPSIGRFTPFTKLIRGVLNNTTASPTSLKLAMRP